MTEVIVIRPEPGCSETVAALAEQRIDAEGFPLFEVRPLPWDVPEPDSFDALLIGSANVLRHGGAGLQAYKGMPAYAVGEKTAQAARDAGLEVIATGEGGLQSVFERLDPEHRRLLRLAGQARVDLDPPQGVTVTERTVYASDPQPMPDALAALLREPAIVLLHSGEAARHFAQLCESKAIDRSRIALATIGPRVAAAAGAGWKALETADSAGEAALLALTARMCQEEPGSNHNDKDGMNAQTETPAGSQPVYPAISTMPPKRRSGRGQLLVALLAFVLGAALVVWVSWRGYLDGILPQSAESAQQSSEQPVAAADMPASGEAEQDGSQAAELAAVGSVEARLAMLEDRFSRLNLQANAASGNAARAESLLIAFAARRMIDRGEPLRYLADQLRLRFTNAQPNAVDTIIEFADDPVTIDELGARLSALEPELVGKSDDESFWDTASRELRNLFTIRSEPSTILSPQARIERVRVMLTAGKIPAAVDEVERLPGADAASKWIVDARRYAEVQRALDLIETTAMLEPRRLQDSEGKNIDQPSPIAEPPSEEGAEGN